MEKLFQHLDPRTKASPAEYIISLICCFILNFGIPQLYCRFYCDDEYTISYIVSVILGIIFLIFIIRRIRDIGLNWTWVFIWLIPFVNIVATLGLCFISSNTFKKKHPTPEPQPEPTPNNETTEPESESPTKPTATPDPLPLTDLEQSLVEKYSALYQQYKNLSPEEATDLATTLIQEAKKEALINDTYYLPINLGDLVLQNTPPTDQNAQKAYDLIQQRLPRLRNEGVTDKDIRWWWNFSQIERSMIIKNDEAERYNYFVTQLIKTQSQFAKKGIATAAAESLTNKRYPLYTQDQQDYFISPDDPLPYELKERIDAFMDHSARFTDFQQILTQLQQSSTFNAFIRQQIQNKKL